MMSTAANDLIERMERETGQRVDADSSLMMAGLFGAIARLMGKSSHQERDNIAAGVLIRHQLSLEGQREMERAEWLADILTGGFPPDALYHLVKKTH